MTDGGMDLRWTAEEEAFRAEARAWLEAHKPDHLPPGDTAEGFPVHRAWERAALRGRLGRGLVAEGLRRARRHAVGVVDLRGGVLPGRAPPAGGPERHLPPGPHGVRVRHPGAAGPDPAPDGRRRGHVVPGLVRAQRRLRPRRHPVPGRARRRPRRMAPVRPEDVDDPRRLLQQALRAVPHRPGRRAPPGHDVPVRRPRAGRRGRATGRQARRRRRLRRGVPRRRLRARRRRARRGEPGLGRRHGHHGLRARPHAALPGSLPGRRGPPGRPAGPPRGRGPRARPRRRRRRRAGLDGRRGLRPQHLRDRDPPEHRARTWVPSRASTRSSGRRWTCA